MRNIRRALVVAAMSALALVGCSSGTGETALRSCESEDSTNCFWDASKQGNGRGMSFVVDQDGNVAYVDAFNDGFRDSKQDDCEQGFQPACVWLATNH
jgi:hypothetical protein